MSCAIAICIGSNCISDNWSFCTVSYTICFLQICEHLELFIQGHFEMIDYKQNKFSSIFEISTELSCLGKTLTLPSL